MKKFLCLLFVLILFPLVSFADDPDPIVGCWYAYFAFSDYAFSTDQNTDTISLFFVEENHVIRNINLVLNKDGTIDTKDFTAGQWSKENGKYVFGLLGYGTEEAHLDGDVLTFDMFGMIVRTHRLQHINMFSDIKSK